MIDDILITARPLGEYRAMFSLTDADLALPVLDCAAGASAFTAEVNAAGGDATACDPRYAEHPATLDALTRSETLRGNEFVRRHHDDYQWSFYRDPDDHLARRMLACRRFVDDITAHPERYVAGSLPDLPFDDASFGLVVSSHLLFSHADKLDERFHLEALREMCRVSSGEVRVFPLVASGSTPAPDVAALLEALDGEHIDTEIRPVDYEFQRGADRMLVCHSRAAAENRVQDHPTA
ncbi:MULTISPECIES: class I SAM-dependent methyltransferase [unclassified Gordonia (in: high G+C Gram-positive bacteria)]|uniref:class I SAM-dependent methyltransferase n=1 Tax=unclassified Gordonia (in: high G+C Gram-positive bacteria) TaxID=2657482 RepID=UPI001F0F617A|nr:class I SAM-dependent methyltransferase [Gordonia sp. ABSL49_1]MCH5642749.1 class I SAM-dependent methyltransferase [Gordonia sp. ABSL49_1]